MKGYKKFTISAMHETRSGDGAVTKRRVWAKSLDWAELDADNRWPDAVETEAVEGWS